MTTLFLKPSDCFNRTIVIRRECPAELGQCCAEPANFSALRLLLSPSPLPTTYLLDKDPKRLAVHM